MSADNVSILGRERVLEWSRVEDRGRLIDDNGLSTLLHLERSTSKDVHMPCGPGRVIARRAAQPSGEKNSG